MATCAGCRFSKAFDPPKGPRPEAPVPEPVPWWKFWEPDFDGWFSPKHLAEIRAACWDGAKHKAETEILCCRFPESIAHSKGFWCGEFKPSHHNKAGRVND